MVKRQQSKYNHPDTLLSEKPPTPLAPQNTKDVVPKTTSTAPPKAESEETGHTLLMPDTPTLLLKPVVDTDSSETQPDLRQRVISAMNRRNEQQDNTRTASLTPDQSIDARHEAVESSQASIPANPLNNNAPSSPFNAHYVTKRLNHSIREAQIAKKYNEAIRLQLLLWKMEDQEISPIEVARKVWLRPAVEKIAKKSTS
ncbi:MAG: hypothetical protein Q9P44_14285 [Anaerolineae bacterium]|nr:hypothetical protein [Anaerolineae bacterium]